MSKQLSNSLAEAGFDQDLNIDGLDLMLSPFPLPDAVSEFFVGLRESDFITDMKRGELYPEVIGSSTRLQRLIARIYGVDPIQAQPNFGCNGCIDTFLSYILREELTGSGRNGFLVATPTYFRYHHKIEALRLRLLGIPFEREFRYPVDAMLDAIKTGMASCLFLVTPNNPTGLAIGDEDLCNILDNAPDDLNIAIDRTCVNIDSEIHTKTLLANYSQKRIAVFHSFSKYYGMSHMRIGFTVFSNRDFAFEVGRYLPFGLNLEATLRATHILATEGELKPSKRIQGFIRENKKAMNTFLDQNSAFSCSDFRSNYAVLRLPKNISSDEFQKRLRNKGIYVLTGHELPVPDAMSVRIHTGGPPKFINRMLETIESWN